MARAGSPARAAVFTHASGVVSGSAFLSFGQRELAERWGVSADTVLRSLAGQASYSELNVWKNSSWMRSLCSKNCTSSIRSALLSSSALHHVRARPERVSLHQSWPSPPSRHCRRAASADPPDLKGDRREKR